MLQYQPCLTEGDVSPAFWADRQRPPLYAVPAWMKVNETTGAIIGPNAECEERRMEDSSLIQICTVGEGNETNGGGMRELMIHIQGI